MLVLRFTMTSGGSVCNTIHELNNSSHQASFFGKVNDDDYGKAFLSDMENAKIIFTSSATEACALALKGKKLLGSEVEHEAVLSWISTTLETNLDGLVTVENPSQSALQLANSETGIIQDLPKNLAASDLTQAFGKIPLAFSWLGIGLGIISGHKIGGPKGIGALVISDDLDVEPLIIGGGQEQGIRAGTENVIAIAGFGAAAEASSKDLNSGLWDEVSRIRDKLEDFIVPKFF